MVRITNTQPRDDNGAVVQGGTDLQFQVLTATQSSANSLNFTGIPVSVLIGTRTAVNDVKVWIGTTTVADKDPYWTIQGADTLALDLAYSGPYYVRGESAVTSLVEFVALL